MVRGCSFTMRGEVETHWKILQGGLKRVWEQQGADQALGGLGIGLSHTVT